MRGIAVLGAILRMCGAVFRLLRMTAFPSRSICEGLSVAALLLKSRGRVDAAAEVGLLLAEYRPTDLLAEECLHQAVVEGKFLQEAAVASQQLLERCPDHTRGRYTLALALYRLGHVEEARSEWERLAAQVADGWSDRAREWLIQMQQDPDSGPAAARR